MSVLPAYGYKILLEENFQGLLRAVPFLDDGLSGSGYLAGERPTIADLSVASSVWQLGLAQIVPEERHVSRWFASISGIEGFQRSLPAGSAS